MISHDFLEVPGIRYWHLSGDVDLDETIAAFLAVRDGGGSASDMNRPVLFDMRDVDMAPFTGADMRRYAERLKARGLDVPGGVAAYVVSNDTNFGMMRMSATYFELSGVRKQENTLVTLDIHEAADWIIHRAGISPSDQAAVRQFLDRQHGGQVRIST
ncbi:hypothetical protein KZZ07_08615 [Mameliella sp. CS4]|uniref:hypothetical protein n=1 Tax=Mameliella sp. CS4 TaxID=2862329 RepID=UPI001C5ED0F3|nr:hypothetical protein [Mameliella sp. CS4]MBW4982601.1 hypothetical protein [Mameliella sp. CS4]